MSFRFHPLFSQKNVVRQYHFSLRKANFFLFPSLRRLVPLHEEILLVRIDIWDVFDYAPGKKIDKPIPFESGVWSEKNGRYVWGKPPSLREVARRAGGRGRIPTGLLKYLALFGTFLFSREMRCIEQIRVENIGAVLKTHFGKNGLFSVWTAKTSYQPIDNRHQSVFLPDEKNPHSCFQKRF